MLRFSVIVPVYNVAKDIRFCFESIVNQTFKDFEVLCVDDCGTDGSMDIVREYAQKDSRFKILTHDHNQGVSAARNTALKAVQGEYILFVDPDDWIELNTFETVDRAITNSNNSDSILFGHRDVFPDGTTDDKNYDYDLEYKITPDILNDIVGVVWNKAFKASKVRELGLEFPVGLIIEDSEFTFRYYVQTESFYMTRGIYYNYRRLREGSYTTDDIACERINDTFKIFERMYDFAIEKKLFKKNRIMFLNRTCRSIKTILYNPRVRDKVLELTDNLLTKMDFPNAFKDLEKPKFTFWKN